MGVSSEKSSRAVQLMIAKLQNKRKQVNFEYIQILEGAYLKMAIQIQAHDF